MSVSVDIFDALKRTEGTNVTMQPGDVGVSGLRSALAPSDRVRTALFSSDVCLQAGLKVKNKRKLLIVAHGRECCFSENKKKNITCSSFNPFILPST